MPSPVARLWFRDADLPASAAHERALDGVTLELSPGELVLVELDERHPSVPLLDAALGLIEPTRGSVGFNTEPWHRRTTKSAAKARSLIGSVLDRAEWLANLKVDQSILLAGEHHSDASDADLRRDATYWAEHFGLEGLPKERPYAVTRAVLRRAACVRALMGKPELLLLEQPTRDGSPQFTEQLIAATTIARRWGASVLWTTTNPAVYQEVAALADGVLRVDDTRLISPTGSTR